MTPTSQVLEPPAIPVRFSVPRELLFDQMASVITADLRDQGARLVENAEFLRFAHHWGFRIRACRP
jgi:transposase